MIFRYKNAIIYEVLTENITKQIKLNKANKQILGFSLKNSKVALMAK